MYTRPAQDSDSAPRNSTEKRCKRMETPVPGSIARAFRIIARVPNPQNAGLDWVEKCSACDQIWTVLQRDLNMSHTQCA
eukprot:3141720-Rhodomonas_salina.2